MHTQCVLDIQSEWSDRETDEAGKSDQVGRNVATEQKAVHHGLAWILIPERFSAISPGSRSAPGVAFRSHSVAPEGSRSAQGGDHLRG